MKRPLSLRRWHDTGTGQRAAGYTCCAQRGEALYIHTPQPFQQHWRLWLALCARPTPAWRARAVHLHWRETELEWRLAYSRELWLTLACIGDVANKYWSRFTWFVVWSVFHVTCVWKRIECGFVCFANVFEALKRGNPMVLIIDTSAISLKDIHFARTL